MLNFCAGLGGCATQFQDGSGESSQGGKVFQSSEVWDGFNGEGTVFAELEGFVFEPVNDHEVALFKELFKWNVVSDTDGGFFSFQDFESA